VFGQDDLKTIRQWEAVFAGLWKAPAYLTLTSDVSGSGRLSWPPMGIEGRPADPKDLEYFASMTQRNELKIEARVSGCNDHLSRGGAQPSHDVAMHVTANVSNTRDVQRFQDHIRSDCHRKRFGEGT